MSSSGPIFRAAGDHRPAGRADDGSAMPMTRMFAEASEASAVIAGQLAANAGDLRLLAERLRRANPRVIFTCARGSSDHAASFAKYLFETHLGIPTLSYAPSISSIYGRALTHMAGQPFIAISQSGKSPDLLASAKAARGAGALVIALTNDANSPLAAIAEIMVPLHAGPEISVAATKSYIATLGAIVHLASLWREERELTSALAKLPEDLADAWDADWSAGVDMLQNARHLYVLGRALTFGIAQEAALKCKETCRIHGEAFSIAEVAHGPMALAGPEFPLLVFPPLGEAAIGLDSILPAFRARGAPVAIIGAKPEQTGGWAKARGEARAKHWADLPLAAGLHPVTAPIAMIQSFYRLANALALRRGLDPDNPPMLRKITETQ